MFKVVDTSSEKKYFECNNFKTNRLPVDWPNMLARRSYANSFSSSPAFRMVSHKTASLWYASMTALVVKGKDISHAVVSFHVKSGKK
jgi:hypothetical protein